MSEDSISERIKYVKESDDREHLIKHLCPFYQLGKHPDCPTCAQTEDDLATCKEVYLSRIGKFPMDIWEESFDRFLVEERNKVSAKEIVGIGVNCDSCYMYDKCPMFKRGHVCGIDWMEDVPKTPEEFFDFLVTTQYERVKRASIFEKVDGGVPDRNLSDEMDRLSGFVAGKAELNRERLSIKFDASAPSGGGGGILAKLFSTPSLSASESKGITEHSSVEDVTPVEDIPIIEKIPKRVRK